MTTQEHVQIFVRAIGPVSRDSIAAELLIQDVAATKENCGELADKAISEGMKAGWLEPYDAADSDAAYVIAD